VGPVTLAITTQPIQCPKYSGANLHDFQLWFRDNEQKLGAWYVDCGGLGQSADFADFCRVQHDIELMRLGERMVPEIERLTSVAEAARELAQSASSLHGALNHSLQIVSESTLTALETALAAAGYDLTEAELEHKLGDA
jgi:hypothetical protein